MTHETQLERVQHLFVDDAVAHPHPEQKAALEVLLQQRLHECRDKQQDGVEVSFPLHHFLVLREPDQQPATSSTAQPRQSTEVSFSLAVQKHFKNNFVYH